MDIGMLWFDNDTKADLSVKVARAATYYQNKYGKRPDLCFVHPSMLPSKRNGGSDGNDQGNHGNEPILKTGDVEVRGTRSVLPNHIWIGVANRQLITA